MSSVQSQEAQVRLVEELWRAQDRERELEDDVEELTEEVQGMTKEREALYTGLYKLTEEWERESVRWYLEQEDPSPTAIIVRSLLEQHVAQVRDILRKMGE